MEVHLAELRHLQRSKVEELKTRTAYYQTKGLIERFDPDRAGGGGNDKPSPALRKEKQLTETQQIEIAPILPQMQQMQQSQRQPSTLDRFVDYLLGSEDAVSSHSRYALICSQCYTHNGLVFPEEYASAHFICMRCGYLNERQSTSNLLEDRKSGEAIVDASSSTSDNNPTTITTSPLRRRSKKLLSKELQ